MDFLNGFNVGSSFLPGSRIADADGIAVDFSDCGVEVLGVLSVGDIEDVTGVVKLQESNATGSGWTDVTGGGFTEVTAGSQTQRISVNRTKRYLRANLVATAGAEESQSFNCAVTLIAKKTSY